MQNEVRRGVNQAKQSEEGANWFFAEIFIISVVTGFYFSSWWVFGGILIGSILLAVNKKTRLALLILLTFGCGAVGWIIGSWFDSSGLEAITSGPIVGWRIINHLVKIKQSQQWLFFSPQNRTYVRK
ncbi:MULTISPECIES: hypothetical protein [unclassified Paenibacillus]|uniref:hypothetical protein n=1 Tax=unclassified Paenibacillus TaxID=185978 RepID=UPI000BA13615|nr:MULTISPECIES: hypothetical protein [unclassified Paenibacillus]OZQ76733.1 hypothetical protein CA598_30260 [Paenibacillus sp. VTT E-133291]